jgi:hypothetical protein
VSRNVFILGAGASFLAGAPLMNSFIRTAQEIQRGNPPLFPKEKAYFDLVFKARTLLQQVHSKSELDINNIETLFGTFEMAALVGKLGTLSDDEITQLPIAINYLIAKTIEARLQYPVRDNKTLPPKPYGEFVESIVRALGEQEKGSVSLITFNYDLGLEFALYYKSIPYEYRTGLVAGVNPGAKQNPQAVDLLKLHGSLNWGHCSKCNRTITWQLRDFLSTRQWAPSPFPVPYRTVEVANLLVQQTCPVCGTSLDERPVIVPPTWNKGKFHSPLASVWRAAAQHLSEAENVFVIGYSLPPTDEFFRYFYALGSVGDSIFDSFVVIDPSDAITARFGSILGPTARNCFSHIRQPFDMAISEIRRRLRLV